MQEVEVRDPPAIFVVVLREVLVAHDIEMIIRDVRPDATVVLARTLHEAANARPEGRIEAAFVQMNAASIAASCLARRVANDRGRVVLVGEEAAQNLPEGWAALPFPFFGDDVTSLLSSVS